MGWLNALMFAVYHYHFPFMPSPGDDVESVKEEVPVAPRAIDAGALRRFKAQRDLRRRGRAKETIRRCRALRIEFRSRLSLHQHFAECL